MILFTHALISFCFVLRCSLAKVTQPTTTTNASRLTSLTPETTTATEPTECDGDFYYDGTTEKCFWINNSPTTSDFDAASGYCQSKGGELATLSSAEQWKFVKHKYKIKANQTIWLGLRCKGMWTDLHRHVLGWRVPCNIHSLSEPCYILENTIAPFKPLQNNECGSASALCEGQGIGISNKTFYSDRKTDKWFWMDDTSHPCQSYGAKLATIDNSEQWKFVKDNVVPANQFIYIGMNCSGIWTDLNGDPLRWNISCYSVPSQPCYQMEDVNDPFHSQAESACSSAGTLCEKPAQAPACIGKYYYNGTTAKCLWEVWGEHNFTTASEYCGVHNGVLATVYDDNQFEFMVNNFRSLGCIFWTGMRCNGSDKWVSSSGDAMVFNQPCSTIPSIYCNYLDLCSEIVTQQMCTDAVALCESTVDVLSPSTQCVTQTQEPTTITPRCDIKTIDRTFTVMNPSTVSVTETVSQPCLDGSEKEPIYTTTSPTVWTPILEQSTFNHINTSTLSVTETMVRPCMNTTEQEPAGKTVSVTVCTPSVEHSTITKINTSTVSVTQTVSQPCMDATETESPDTTTCLTGQSTITITDKNTMTVTKTLSPVDDSPIQSPCSAADTTTCLTEQSTITITDKNTMTVTKTLSPVDDSATQSPCSAATLTLCTSTVRQYSTTEAIPSGAASSGTNTSETVIQTAPISSIDTSTVPESNTLLVTPACTNVVGNDTKTKGKQPLSPVELGEKIEEIERNLRLQRNDLSSTKRKRQTASDQRRTSLSIGLCGLFVIVIFVLGPALFDLRIICSDIKNGPRNVHAKTSNVGTRRSNPSARQGRCDGEASSCIELREIKH